MPIRAPQHSSIPLLAHEAAGFGPLVPGVRGDDGGEEGAGRLDVVVVAVHPALGQPCGLIFGQHAGTDGDVEARLLADERHELQEALHGALVGAAHGQHDAELRCAECGGLAGGGEDLLGIEEGRGLDGRVEAGRLRAEVAVLGTSAGLGREDPLDLHLGPAPGQPDLVGQRGQRHDRAVGQCGQRGQLGAGQEPALVEERPFGSGDDRPFGRGQGRLGRWGRRGRDGGAEGERGRGRHDAHGSGRVRFAGSRGRQGGEGERRQCGGRASGGGGAGCRPAAEC